MINKHVKHQTLSFLVVLLSNFYTFAQQLTGNLPQLPNQAISLYGYKNFERYLIDSTQTNAKGEFTLRFTAKNYGVAVLNSKGLQANILLLAPENIAVQLVDDAEVTMLKITQGKQNLLLQQYILEQPKRQQALSAWDFLQRLYATDSLFITDTPSFLAIQQAKQSLQAQESTFLQNLPANSLLRWYIPLRNLIGSVGQVAQQRTHEIPTTLAALRQINYADERLYKSGVLNQAIENHIWFIENSSGPLDSVFTDLNRSIDIIIKQLKDDKEKFNLVTKYLFEVLEKRSLYTSSEYLAKRLLDSEDCGCLNPEFEKQLHKYGKMAKGATVPDIVFTKFSNFPEGIPIKTMRELNADYYLVIFAAGWCGHCQEEMPKLKEFYPTLKGKKIEVVLVSLDEHQEGFSNFTKSLPFISTTDLQKWNGKAATDYQVYGTPSYFMLNKDLQILQKIKDVNHLKAWVEWVFPN
jgi:thiol-disulfide isomerase/thioredoxin